MILTRRAGIALALVIATVLLYATYLGLFATITVTEGVAGPFTFVYREMHGSDMSQVGAITTALDHALARAGIAQRQPDFPRRNRLSFIVGAAKVDKAFADYRASHGYARAEAYALNAGDTIRYFQWTNAVAR